MSKEKKYGIWFPEKIDGQTLQNLADWLNSWADFDSHSRCLDSTSTIGKDKLPNHITEYGEGYRQATSDIFDKFNLTWKMFDKRTKTGFKKVKGK